MRKATFVLLALFLVSSYIYPYPAEDVYNLTGNDYFPEVKKLLGSAKKSIYITMYIATYYPDYPDSPPNQLLQELIEAQKRGVEVRIILDQARVSPKGQFNDLAYFLLKDTPINVDYDIPSQKLHDKLIIIDEHIVIIGSHNWSKYALEENREASVVIKSPILAQRFIEWIKSTPLSPRRTPPPESKAPNIYIPYKFLSDPSGGSRLIRLHAYDGFKLYIYLLTKWTNETLLLDYYDVATYLGIEDHRYYRRDINRILQKLSKKYHLIKVNIKFWKPAEVVLLDYKDRRSKLLIDPRGSFIIPGAFWEFNWAKILSTHAIYFYFINLVETSLSMDLQGFWSHSQKHLYKKYHLGPQPLSDGGLELNRYNLLKVEYGYLVYPFKEYLTAPRYLLLPLYSWEWHQEQIKNLETLYGKKKVAKARHWASVVLEENNLEAIEKLINYSDEYGEEIVQYAVDKVSAKRIGNRKRSFVYLEAIILREGRDRQEEKED